jgi:glycosyltransferase involved in cell wall biosynthesis
VGLFTEGKNQGELIEYARSLEEFPIDFHFVGNQAGNFKYYWEPLMSDLPKNCKVWGERSDVDLFYQASDLFVFPSNFELNPLCVKEALSWKNKVLMKKLETYESTYDNNYLVSYLSDNKKENIFLILESLGFVKNVK